MIKWWKQRQRTKTLSIKKKLNNKITVLEGRLEDSDTLLTIKTKQYDDYMLKANKDLERVLELLDEEKSNNDITMGARLNQIRDLKARLKTETNALRASEDNNETLKTTLGHF